uniref:Transmembrane protein 182 n=1 Tax=Oryctolagus cuniculus TaxID=9986 RepID=A0A5F9CVT7_RABIT
MRGEHNSTSYDSAVIYRGFWAVLMLLGVVAVVTASFLIICAAPFASHFLYKAGGGSYIAAGMAKKGQLITVSIDEAGSDLHFILDPEWKWLLVCCKKHL